MSPGVQQPAPQIEISLLALAAQGGGDPRPDITCAFPRLAVSRRDGQFRALDSTARADSESAHGTRSEDLGAPGQTMAYLAACSPSWT